MKTILICLAITLVSICSNAQLQGSGKTITKTYEYKHFDKLNFIGFNDDISIEVGKAFSIKITMKEENENKIIFSFNPVEHELSLKVKPQTRKEMYEERDTYQVKITLPEISVVSNTGNGNISVTGILGRYFRAETTGNGDVICLGSIDELEIVKMGNGNVNAKKLQASTAKIKSVGNGDVLVNVSTKIEAQNTGNGSVKNYGKALFDKDSSNKGNGTLQNL